MIVNRGPLEREAAFALNQLGRMPRAPTASGSGLKDNPIRVSNLTLITILLSADT